MTAGAIARERDTWGNWVINKAYNATILAEALCKLEASSTPQAPRSTGATGRSTEHNCTDMTTEQTHATSSCWG